MKAERKPTAAANTPSVQSEKQLNAVLEHQKTVTAAEEAIHKLEQLIAAKKAEIDQVNSSVPNLGALNRVREDLLAAVAAGDAMEAELQQFDQKSETERADAKTAATQAVQKVESLEQAISGLERKLDHERGKNDQLNIATQTLLRELLQSETRIAAEVYLQATADLEKASLRLVSLDSIMAVAGLKPRTISAAKIDELYVPVLSAVGFEGSQKYPAWPGVILSGRLLDLSGAIKLAVQSEQKRFQESGVSGI